MHESPPCGLQSPRRGNPPRLPHSRLLRLAEEMPWAKFYPGPRRGPFIRPFTPHNPRRDMT
jgi:hypothetical protein